MNIFLTGPPGSGKSTVIKKVMEQLREEKLKAGGILCPEIRDRGRRVGFEIVDVLTGERGILSHVLQPHGPRVSKYRVNLANLSRIGVKAIETALDRADYIVIDEVGPMELQGKDFQRTILMALKSSKPILGIIHWKARHPVIDTIKTRNEVKIISLTRENRDSMHKELTKQILKKLKSKR